MINKSKIKGIVFFYVNVEDKTESEIYDVLEKIKNINMIVENKVLKSNYLFIYVPTTCEATRQEKVDYNNPFPRCQADCVDVEEFGVSDKNPITTDNVDEFINEGFMNGFITLFINFTDSNDLDQDKVLKIIKDLNKKSLDKIASDNQYDIMFVPTTKEATRVQKVDYNMPFPRLVTKTIVKKEPQISEEPDVCDDEDDNFYNEIKDVKLEKGSIV